ncbi:MAG: O-succinylbenzoic acid--CoA ligase [Flavobacterium sp. BFFFF1]|uniref:AMP-binding protein n=1 Tax=Flavobacterium sp. BFFFF1 TaxID=2015557 RepID=UPI000BD1EC5B|nr:AMP-binding protein [Flavobacterium sp. BFFFF1]OYU80995.1 MAG: O-succinylbenzoic acid--CoA ligase [Flavobacterium sp. BFFFF1]
MNTPNYTQVHNRFKLNGFHLDKDDLCRVAYSFIKEGDDFERPVGHFLLDWFDHNDFIEMNTSGSTGIPKVIRVEKQAMVNSALATGNFFDLAPGDKVLNCLPVKYVAGKMMLVRGFILGLDMDFVAPTAHPLRNNDTQYAFSAMVPLQAQNSVAELHQIKKLIVGGAKINASLEKDLKKLPGQAFETYGMTETVSHIAAKKVGDKNFTVLPNVSIASDDRNCLVITAPDISQEPIITNDIVELISDKKFIWKGRIDNVVNSGGIKLIPESIEEKLYKKIDRRFFVAGMPDSDLGEKLILAIEGEAYTLPETIFDKLDKYEKPKEIIFIPHFKETGNGKIIRRDSLM